MDTGGGSHLPHSSSSHRKATRSLVYAVGLGIGRRRSNSSEAKRDTWRKPLNRAHARGVTRVVEVTDDLPASSSASPGLIPHVYMEAVWGVKAKVNEHPAIGKVSGGLHLGLVNGAVEIPGISGYAQGALYLLKPRHSKRGDNQRNEHHHEHLER